MPTAIARLGQSLLVLSISTVLAAQRAWPEPGIRKIEGERGVRWRAVAIKGGPSADAAKLAAEQDARRMLADSARSRIESDLKEVVRERDRDGKASSETEVTSLVRQTTDVELRRAVTLHVDARRAAAGFDGYAEVEIAEVDLFPTARLRDALAKDGTAALLAVAESFEADQLWALAEQALQHARDRDGGPRVLFRLGQHHEKRARLEEAVHWFTAVAQSEDADAKRRAEERIAAIRARVPSIREIVDDIRKLAEARREPARFLVTSRREGGRVNVAVDIREANRRVLCTWIDDELYLHRIATDAPLTRSGTLPLDHPRAEGAEFPARFLFWSLPADDALWTTLDAKEQDVHYPLAGDVPVEHRMRLQELIARLRQTDAAAGSVDMDR